MVHQVTRLFPLWALFGCALAYLWPPPFVAARPAIVPLLALVMFGMGLTLTFENFREVLRRPGLVSLGVGLQFLFMPFIGWLLVRLMELPAALAAGVILVGSCPGGTASNVVCYLARGDVALSITLTASSTLLAVVATPFLTWWYVGQTVPVPVLELLLSIAKMVLIPVLAGLLINRYLHHRLARVQVWFPLLSMAAIVVIIAIIVAINRDQLPRVGALLGLAVVLHNLAGLSSGYLLPRLLGRSPRECRTLSIEVGMQNSGLAVALASQYFSAAAALPGALFSLWHNLSGSWLAAIWSRSRPSVP
jgi:BASS family bile acid:Na+ symporter